uniref:Elongation factor Ts, chloroplastic n=1 Tax=Cyanidium caldarium TaxID=2771 RepID=EFTS_CYACA|nr:elongation factor Ts [Cyanidium caldarium]Q9TM32.1 RecName: Full=Elongation factor Ts, chloroplastic; Short=EF-Ts [Cyanidium caldarium]AAF13011.1 unknown [Cyanidium caldarium]WDB00162.1 elongation factor Ts [Cyanidium caldarium]
MSNKSSKTSKVSIDLIKQLREKTGVSIKDCKEALRKHDGDIAKALREIQEQGSAIAQEKHNRITVHGRIASYIHINNRMGSLVEINCETDSAANSEEFAKLCQHIAMQIVACPEIKYVKFEDIPEEIKNHYIEVESQSKDLQDKPAQSKNKIIRGRIDKKLRRMCLLDQANIKDDKVTVNDLIKEKINKFKENIQINRFARFTIGEKI